MSSRLRAGIGMCVAVVALGAGAQPAGSQSQRKPARSRSFTEPPTRGTAKELVPIGDHRRHAGHRVPAEGERPGGQGGHRRDRQGDAQVPHAEPGRQGARCSPGAGDGERRLREQPLEAEAGDALPARRAAARGDEPTPPATQPDPDSDSDAHSDSDSDAGSAPSDADSDAEAGQASADDAASRRCRSSRRRSRRSSLRRTRGHGSLRSTPYAQGSEQAPQPPISTNPDDRATERANSTAALVGLLGAVHRAGWHLARSRGPSSAATTTSSWPPSSTRTASFRRCSTAGQSTSATRAWSGRQAIPEHGRRARCRRVARGDAAQLRARAGPEAAAVSPVTTAPQPARRTGARRRASRPRARPKSDAVKLPRRPAARRRRPRQHRRRACPGTRRPGRAAARAPEAGLRAPAVLRPSIKAPIVPPVVAGARERSARLERRPRAESTLSRRPLAPAPARRRPSPSRRRAAPSPRASRRAPPNNEVDTELQRILREAGVDAELESILTRRSRRGRARGVRWTPS